MSVECNNFITLDSKPGDFISRLNKVSYANMNKIYFIKDIFFLPWGS